MSIADHNRISALEARIAELERKHEMLSKLVTAYREAESKRALEMIGINDRQLKAGRRG